jgi:hypothetical protein
MDRKTARLAVEAEDALLLPPGMARALETDDETDEEEDGAELP